MVARLRTAKQLIAAYPAIHPSIYAPITSSSRVIAARERHLHCPPPPGCPTWPSSFTASLSLRLNTALVRTAEGAASFARLGHALKCFHLWACLHDVPDSCRMPLRPDVLEHYLASLAGYFSKKTIRARVTQLQRWHARCRVDWIIKTEHFEAVINAAYKIAPYIKLKRAPFLLDHLTACLAHLDLGNSFDVAWAAATCFAHCAILRSGEFTLPSQPAFSPELHLTLGCVSFMYVDGRPIGVVAHLSWDKVNGRRGADVSATRLEGDHITCPVRALLRHLTVNRVAQEDSLFSFFASRGRSAGQRCHLTKDLWRRRLGELLALAGLPPMSGHTVRIGGATQLLLDGVDPLVVKVAGRWKSDAFEAYWRNVTAVLARHQQTGAPARAPTVRQPDDLLAELRSLAGMEEDKRADELSEGRG
ncbi:hypothetical protein JCM5296_007205 [Sporobolomyces johnsonii]